MNDNQPKVLIVILNYGTYDLTVGLIKDLQTNLDYSNYTIFVIDNCSPNESARVLEAKSKEMNFIFFANKSNSGYAAGNNIGIRYGIEHGFDYSWILNNDVELREKTILKRLVEDAETDISIGCVGPLIYSYDGNKCAPYVNRPSFWDMTFGIINDRRRRMKSVDETKKVYRVYGCCMLLKNSVMQAVDLLDERTFLYGEECILAERMMKKNYISYYDAGVSVTHKESSSLKRMSKQRKGFQISESKKSRELYLKEYRGFSILQRWLCHTVRSLIIRFRM